MPWYPRLQTLQTPAAGRVKNSSRLGRGGPARHAQALSLKLNIGFCHLRTIYVGQDTAGEPPKEVWDPPAMEPVPLQSSSLYIRLATLMEIVKESLSLYSFGVFVFFFLLCFVLFVGLYLFCLRWESFPGWPQTSYEDKDDLRFLIQMCPKC